MNRICIGTDTCTFRDNVQKVGTCMHNVKPLARKRWPLTRSSTVFSYLVFKVTSNRILQSIGTHSGALAYIEEGDSLYFSSHTILTCEFYRLPSRLQVSLEQVDMCIMWILSGRDAVGLGLAWLHICASKLSGQIPLLSDCYLKWNTSR